MILSPRYNDVVSPTFLDKLGRVDVVDLPQLFLLSWQQAVARSLCLTHQILDTKSGILTGFPEDIAGDITLNYQP